MDKESDRVMLITKCESGRILQAGCGVCLGFDFLGGYSDHRVDSFFHFVPSGISAKMHCII